MTEEPVFTVSEINERIKGLLDADPALRSVTVSGELSNYKVYSSGHHYFTLKDQNSTLRCVMFKSAAGKVRFRPDNGLSVLCRGYISVYPRDGGYQLYVNAMSAAGIGDLYLAYEQLKARLEAEGLFDRAHKQPLPAFPKRIAVITSGSGAAVRDVIRVLGKRWPMAKVVILPVRVQGAEAPRELAGAVRYANKYNVADLIIIGRGGGSIEDLWAFNDEALARVIHASEIPVISAVGHEPDFTISDFVADVRAATPSNGAELAVPDQAELRDRLRQLEIRMEQVMQKRIALLSRRLDSLRTRRVLEDPGECVDRKRMEADRLRERLLSAAERSLAVKRREQVRLAASLDALSPLKVLSRGYSVVQTGEGRVITDSAALTEGQLLSVTLYRGAAECRVETVISADQTSAANTIHQKTDG